MTPLVAMAGTMFGHGVGFHCVVEAEVGGEKNRDVID